MSNAVGLGVTFNANQSSKKLLFHRHIFYRLVFLPHLGDHTCASVNKPGIDIIKYQLQVLEFYYE
jgi:hypothetical protein